LSKGGFAEVSKNLIVLEAGSAIEEMQNCHIGNYMEGYLTQRNNFSSVSKAAAKPSLLLFCADFSRPIHLYFFKKIDKKGENDEFWPSFNRNGNTI
jgi:hypothetical protein